MKKTKFYTVGNKKTIPESVICDIIKEYTNDNEDKLTLAQIYMKFNITCHMLYRILNVYNIPRRQNKKDSIDEYDILKYKMGTISFEELKNKYSYLNEITIRSIINRYGFSSKMSKYKTKEKAIISLFNSGLKYKEIANKLNTSMGSVEYYIFKKRKEKM